MTGRLSDTTSADGPSADMLSRPDFVKVLILRDMELGETAVLVRNFLVFLKAHPLARTL